MIGFLPALRRGRRHPVDGDHLGDALDAIGAFAHDDHVGLGLEQGAQPEAHNEMIVDDQDPDLVHALIPQPARSPSLACPAGAESRS